MKYPILYSFRRCPYAIRARLALSYLDLNIELREVHLKNRPKELYTISSKGTVPVLYLLNKTIIDESLDIMLWANNNYKKQNLLNIHSNKQKIMIKKNDSKFKYWLDKYKYFDRYPDNSKDYYFEKASTFLYEIENKLLQNKYIMGKNIQMVDLAIFPFIRQFANVDLSIFENKFCNINNWYLNFLKSVFFKNVMNKYKFWSINDDPLIINFNK